MNAQPIAEEQERKEWLERTAPDAPPANATAADRFEELVGKYRTPDVPEPASYYIQGEFWEGFVRHKPEQIEQALKAGADPNKYEEDAIPPLHSMALYDDAESALVMLAHGANLESKNKLGQTPLLFAAAEGSEGCITLLLNQRANTEARDISGKTPLIAAAEANQKNAVAKLAEAKANVNAADAEGNTPMHYAARHGELNIIETLWNGSADLNAANAKGKTPLMIAAENGKIPAVRLMLAKGADTAPFADKAVISTVLSSENSRDPSALKRAECLRCIAATHDARVEEAAKARTAQREQRHAMTPAALPQVKRAAEKGVEAVKNAALAQGPVLAMSKD